MALSSPQNTLTPKNIALLVFVFITVLSGGVYLGNTYLEPAIEKREGGDELVLEGSRASVDQSLTDGKFKELITVVNDHYKLNNLRDAQIAISEALEVASTDQEKAVAHHWQALIYYQRHTKDGLNQAEQEEYAALAILPTYADPYVTLSAIARDKGQFDKALEYALKGVELAPDNPWARNNLGIMYLEFDRNAEAIVELKKAVELAPDNDSFRNNLQTAESGEK